MNVSEDQADELVKSKQAVPADGTEPTHELVPADSNGEHAYDDDDEVDWALDDAATVVEDSETSFTSGSTTTATLSFFGRSEKETTKKLTGKALLFPFILPQRRPGTKTRGFVRAYAPVLEDTGIDQHMFLTFLKDFHQAVQASPIFDVLIVATTLAGSYPDPLVGIGIQAVQIAVAIGQEAQERWRTNKFLDQANKDIFMTRGMYALLVTYVPGTQDQAEIGTQTVDLGASAFARYGDSLAPATSTSIRVRRRALRRRWRILKKR